MGFIVGNLLVEYLGLPLFDRIIDCKNWDHELICSSLGYQCGRPAISGLKVG